MRRAGYTSKPCPGCKVNIPHPIGGVCQYCSDKLERYTQIMKERESAPDTVVMRSKERGHALPYLSNIDNEVRSTIQNNFVKLVAALSTPSRAATADPEIFESKCPLYRPYEWVQGVRIRPDHAKLLGETYEAVRLALLEAYGSGHKRGRWLLGQLASGEITADKFNESALREENRT